MADLPPEWANEETSDGNIVYINLRTGQKTFEHPCDEYYRQIVIKERRKRGGSRFEGMGVHPIGSGMGVPLPQNPQKDMDPLLKMEMEKKKKKLE